MSTRPTLRKTKLAGGTAWRWFAEPEPDREYLALATYLELKSAFGLPRFEWHSLRVHRAMGRAPGLVGFSFSGKFPTRYWTLSVWESGRDLGRFVRAPIHAKAKSATTPLMARFDTARWKVAGQSIPPDWSEAKARLEAEPLS